MKDDGTSAHRSPTVTPPVPGRQNLQQSTISAADQRGTPPKGLAATAPAAAGGDTGQERQLVRKSTMVPESG
ncbi:hypothetical protein GCM10018781_22050 [Kitasatospora indigofera]|uniref:Uncharacterized protein n=1 Tax=Kitasatospora indigofera TaxID=67307 RepID=A0A919KNY8_9ACTN|nr:hypothetical protein GCM10018781_22050 [Kitasatospora indigofera]